MENRQIVFTVIFLAIIAGGLGYCLVLAILHGRRCASTSRPSDRFRPAALKPGFHCVQCKDKLSRPGNFCPKCGGKIVQIDPLRNLADRLEPRR